jgi:hypothetical protein
MTELLLSSDRGIQPPTHTPTYTHTHTREKVILFWRVFADAGKQLLSRCLAPEGGIQIRIDGREL